jgi:hypothetical protein
VIQTDAEGKQHVYDSDGQELDVAGFTLDYDRETGACFISLVFNLPVELDIIGEYLEGD